MARVTYVKKAQASKYPRRCVRCGKDIEIGKPYKWFALKIGRFSDRKNFHTDCTIRRSDQTSSSQLGTLYDAIESAEEALGTLGDFTDPGDVTAILEEAADGGVTEAGEMYGESADNIEEGFGHSTYVSEEIREKADQLESFADELRDLQIDEFDEDAAIQEAEEEVAGNTSVDPDDEDAVKEAVEAEVEQKWQEWRDNAISEAESVLGGCPL